MMTKEDIRNACEQNGLEKGVPFQKGVETWKSYDRKTRQAMRMWFNDNGFERVKDDRHGLYKDGVRVNWQEGCANLVISF